MNKSILEEVEKNGQVGNSVEELNSGMEDLSQCVDRLENRLEKILLPATPSTQTETPKSDLVPLASRIAGITKRLRMIIDTISSIRERCEL